MLPRAHGGGVPEHKHVSFLDRTHAIGNEPVPSPVSAAYHIPSARRGELQLLPVDKKTASPRRCHEFGAAFAAAVRIVAAHRVNFAVWPRPFAVFVAFVTGDDEHGADTVNCATGFEQMDCTHDIGLIGTHRILI